MKESETMKRKWHVILLIMFVIISGASFPIFNLTKHYTYSLTSILLYTNILCYIELGIYEKKMLKRLGIKHAAIINLGVILLGMLCRYILEFGEVSNTYNFTIPNILLHISATFIISMLSYLVYRKTE